ncbi:MAG: hypothetical protein NTY36_14080 [Deltaproteobacteria bacterium]|nr:hypothetical protein [Deltaproteobacteria bacterium]
MKDQLEPDLIWQMEEAQQLLELGKLQDALVLAMDVLWRELDQLREALDAIKGNLPPCGAEVPAAAPEVHPQSEFIWPDPPSRLLH